MKEAYAQKKLTANKPSPIDVTDGESEFFASEYSYK